MWMVRKEIYSADGELIEADLQARNMPEREAADMAQQLNTLEAECPTYDDGARVYYYPTLERS